MLTCRIVKSVLGAGSKEMHQDLLAFMAKHDIRPVIDKVFKFEDAKAAYEYSLSGQAIGKVVISCR